MYSLGPTLSRQRAACRPTYADELKTNLRRNLRLRQLLHAIPYNQKQIAANRC